MNTTTKHQAELPPLPEPTNKLENYMLPDLNEIAKEMDREETRLHWAEIQVLADTNTATEVTDDDPLIQRLRGRADYLRNMGEVKTPDLLTSAADELEAALASQPQQAEPVAWQERQEKSPGVFGEWYDRKSGWALTRPSEIDSGGIRYQFRPLYTAPQQAAVPAGWRFDCNDGDSITVHRGGYSCTLWKSGHGGVETLAYQMAKLLAAPEAPAAAQAVPGCVAQASAVGPEPEAEPQPAEFCWLVELFLGDGTGNSLGWYHTGFTDISGNSRSTQDPLKAKRYSTWREANLASVKLGHTLQGTWRAVQHGFVSNVPAQPVPEAPAATRAVLCHCRDRHASECPGEWEPGCDLGNNPAHAVVVQPAPELRLDAERTLAARDVLAERQRQISVEGWTSEHDDEHDTSAMASAAGCYALAAASWGANDFWRGRLTSVSYDLWPWDREWWKPSEPRRMLVKAGALILAEIERLDRAALAAEKQGGGV